MQELLPAFTHPFTQWEGMNGANLDPETGQCLWRGVSVLALTPPHPKGLTKGCLCPQASASTPCKSHSLSWILFFPEEHLQAAFTGLSLGTSSLNKHSIPAANLVTFGKSSENRWKSKSVSICCCWQLHFQTIGYCLFCASPGHPPALTCNLQGHLPSHEQRGQVMAFRWMQEAELFSLS